MAGRAEDPGAGRLCPSAPAMVGATLVAISIDRGTLGYVTPPVTVDRQFLAAAGEVPERNFRFAAPCLKGGCHNWGDRGCELIHRVLDTHADAGAHGPLPVCGIRADCRWFAQAGAAACRVCPIIRNPATPKAA